MFSSISTSTSGKQHVVSSNVIQYPSCFKMQVPSWKQFQLKLLNKHQVPDTCFVCSLCTWGDSVETIIEEMCQGIRKTSKLSLLLFFKLPCFWRQSWTLFDKLVASITSCHNSWSCVNFVSSCTIIHEFVVYFVLHLTNNNLHHNI